MPSADLLRRLAVLARNGVLASRLSTTPIDSSNHISSPVCHRAVQAIEHPLAISSARKDPAFLLAQAMSRGLESQHDAERYRPPIVPQQTNRGCSRMALQAGGVAPSKPKGAAGKRIMHPLHRVLQAPILAAGYRGRRDFALRLDHMFDDLHAVVQLGRLAPQPVGGIAPGPGRFDLLDNLPAGGVEVGEIRGIPAEWLPIDLDIEPGMDAQLGNRASQEQQAQLTITASLFH